MSPIRYMPPNSFPPEMNMAIDEALFSSVVQGRSAGHFRVYRWEPHSLSFGFFQKIERILDIGRIPGSGIGVVRRMTGGKMVFHAREWTFSLCLPMGFISSLCNPNPTFLEIFLRMMQPLLEGLNSLGLPVRFGRSGMVTFRGAPSPDSTRKGGHSGVNCFSSAAGHSVFLGERKLIGSAGICRNGVFSIHGSIPISKIGFPQGVFLAGVDPEPELGMAFLEDSLSTTEIEKVPRVLASAIGMSLGVECIPASLDPQEERCAGILAREKYSHLDWNKTRPEVWDDLAKGLEKPVC